jgi:sulfide:quinone oxidoreductase
VEKGKVVLAEFGYGGKLLPTFPLDPTQSRRSMWFLKATLLPWFYWNGMLKGREWLTAVSKVD